MPAALSLRVAVLAAALALSAGPAPAEPVSTEEFEALAEGMTLRFALDGIPFGAEQFFAGRRSLWQFADGTCQEGRWWADGGMICFAYSPDPAEMCWRLTRETGRLFAESMVPGGLRLEMTGRDDIPLPCPGPDVGS
jgi:hypothetical protein